MIKAADMSRQKFSKGEKKPNISGAKILAERKEGSSGDRPSSNIETDGLEGHAILPFSIKYLYSGPEI